MQNLLENKNIPKSSGCYLFKDERDQVIYVGKSKFLPKRVSSYFQKKHDDIKTRTLVESIRNVDFVITESEAEALIVEENLIKLYQPKFNIKGKDDKTIRLHLTIVDENFPRLELERGTENSVNGEHLAQFTSGTHAREVYKLIHQVFPLRSCSYNLSDENIEAKKFKTCLEYQIKNCGGVCQGEVKKIFYNKMISEIKSIFNFNPEPALKSLIKRRNFHAKNFHFEKCQDLQNRIASLQELIKKIEPLRLNRIKNDLKEIGDFLKLKSTPLIIESFDNSHTSGSDGVAASIRFVMGKPEKSSYRKFIIKTAKVGDDYSSFEEVLQRRFSRILREKTQLPDLVIMDGGKGQLSVAQSIFNKLGIKIDVIGLSKDERHKARWIHLTCGDTIDLFKVPNYAILGKISEEVHRFTIKFHKEKRDKI
jgi:excinuclease ABC subunit C